MRIAGLQKCSFVDYPGKLAAVVFTVGCNLHCFYCHNHRFIGTDSPANMTVDDVQEWLERRRDMLDAVVVSGGEPTMQRGLVPFLCEIRSMGYAVKLDTNGTSPEVLRTVIDSKLVNYVAMDVKAPASRYAEITGRGDVVRNIAESIAILQRGRIDYEFRTTYAPPLEMRDMIAIARCIAGAKRYYIQHYRRDLADERRHLPEPHSDAYLAATLGAVREYVPAAALRNPVQGAPSEKQLVRPAGATPVPMRSEEEILSEPDEVFAA